MAVEFPHVQYQIHLQRVDFPSPCVFARGYQMLNNRQIIRVDVPPHSVLKGCGYEVQVHPTAPISTNGCHYLNVSPANLESVPSTFLPNKFTEGTRQTFPFFACSWSCCDKSLKMYTWMIPYSLAAYVQLRSYARGYEPWRKTSGNSPGRSTTDFAVSESSHLNHLLVVCVSLNNPTPTCPPSKTKTTMGLTYMVCFWGVM